MSWAEVKRLVINRDKKCRKCGVDTNLTIDHVLPLSRGGTNTPDNLQALCKACNEHKSSFISWDFVQRLKIAMHVDALVMKTRSELRSEIQGTRTDTKKIAESVKSWVGDYVGTKLDEEKKKVFELEKKLSALEKYLKLEYKKEVETFEGYKKITK